MTKGLPWVYDTLWGSSVPASSFGTPFTRYTIANLLTCNANGRVVGMRYALLAGHNTDPVALFLSSQGPPASLLASAIVKPPATWTTPPNVKWQTAYFRKMIRLAAGDKITISAEVSLGYAWQYTDNALTSNLTVGDFTYLADSGTVHNGREATPTALHIIPNNASSSARRYGIDLLWLSDVQAGV